MIKVMNRCAALILLLLVPMIFAVSASAAPCHTFRPDERDAPSSIKEILDRAPSSAVQICGNDVLAEGAKAFFMSAIAKGNYDVCYYTVRPLFRRGDAGRIDWTFVPPAGQEHLRSQTSYMYVSHDGCPPQGDSRYIVASDVSEGVFVTLFQGWSRIISSAKEFALATANLPAEITNSNMFRRAQNDVGDNAPNRPKLLLVALSQGGTDVPHYSLEATSGSGAWAIVGDLIDGRLVVIGFGTRTP